MSQPWIKFYPRDWRGDQALRAVSIAARGLWMECLCVMHEASPYGHLVLNGAPVEAPVLARMTGTTEEEVKALLAELSRSGVSSVTRGGVVFSRRMVSDFSRANKGRKAVEKRYAQTSEKAEENDGPNRSPSRSPITQRPESQKPDSSSLRSEQRAPKMVEPDGFAEFYTTFPLKKARPKAAKAYADALKAGFSPADMLAGARRYAAERRGEESRFTAHPATWLNQRRWQDEPVSPQSSPGGRHGGQSSNPSFASSISRAVSERASGSGLFPETGEGTGGNAGPHDQENPRQPPALAWRNPDAA